MKVFISWSGTRSERVAHIIRTWMPGVLQAVRPYFSPADLDKGTRWQSEIAKELQENQAAIAVLSKESVKSSWLNFEIGAISKAIETSRIYPIVVDLEKAEVPYPIAQFQSTSCDKADFQKLIFAMNEINPTQVVEKAALQLVFDALWPQFESSIKAELAQNSESEENLVRKPDLNPMVEEILLLVRTLAERKQFIVPPRPRTDLSERSDVPERLAKLCYYILSLGRYSQEQIDDIWSEITAIAQEVLDDPWLSRRSKNEIRIILHKYFRSTKGYSKIDDDVPF